MFAGLIEWVGRLDALSLAGAQARLVVDAQAWSARPEIGESIAVQGVCLTLVERAAGRLAFDVLKRTLELTALPQKHAGAALNLEQALKMGAPVGGHFVSGHVDGLAQVRAWRRDGADYVLSLSADAELMMQIIPKGSVAIDGVSLTVADLAVDSFEVRIIPHTWQHTSLRELTSGDKVNLETDMLGKYARRAAEQGSAPEKKPLAIQDLLNAGFEP